MEYVTVDFFRECNLHSTPLSCQLEVFLVVRFQRVGILGKPHISRPANVTLQKLNQINGKLRDVQWLNTHLLSILSHQILFDDLSCYKWAVIDEQRSKFLRGEVCREVADMKRRPEWSVEVSFSCPESLG
jgi:hypothetical protein